MAGPKHTQTTMIEIRRSSLLFPTPLLKLSGLKLHTISYYTEDDGLFACEEILFGYKTIVVTIHSHRL